MKSQEEKKRDLRWHKGREREKGNCNINVSGGVKKKQKKLNKKTDCHNYRQLQWPTMHETHYLKQREKI